jgi:hypothetical protein
MVWAAAKAYRGGNGGPHAGTFKSGDASGTSVPSTLVHVSLALLLAAGLLGTEFDGRSALVVVAATAVPDLDVALEPLLSGAHRSVGHNFVLPALLFVALAVDARRGPDSLLRRRYGDRGVTLAFTAVVCLFGAGIVPDLVVGGINAFYPLHDAFYTVDGRLFYSTDRGWVQTFVDISPDEPEPQRTTGNFDFRTVLDAEPTLGVEQSGGGDGGGSGGSRRVERLFPVAMTGFRAWLLPLAAFVTGTRLWRARRSADAETAAETEAAAERGDGA